MLNRIFIQGRLTKIPEMRMTNSGKQVCSFTLAVDRDKEHTDFIPCVAWEKRAEFVSKYFTRGQEALVCGSLSNREYTDKNDVKRTVSEVIVSEIHFCGSKSAARDQSGAEREPVFSEDGELPF